MSLTDKAKSDAKLQARVIEVVQDAEENGLPRTKEGLKELYAVYNEVYGKNKKPTNCIYCRRTVADYLTKAILLLEIKPKAKKKPAPNKRATEKAPAKPKKRTAKKPASKK